MVENSVQTKMTELSPIKEVLRFVLDVDVFCGAQMMMMKIDS